MAEEPAGAQKYTGNANRDKIPAEEEKPKVEPVVKSGAVERKKPLSRRIAESFTGPDAQSVGHYLFFEVVLPRIKDLVFDVGDSALRRTLYGDSAQGYASRSTGGAKAYTAYNTIASSAINKAASASSKSQTPGNEFGEIIVRDRGEAQEVMDKMANLIERFGVASVADLKAAVSLTGTFMDNKFGWDGMGGTDIRRVGGADPGYLLVFPQPQELA